MARRPARTVAAAVVVTGALAALAACSSGHDAKRRARSTLPSSPPATATPPSRCPLTGLSPLSSQQVDRVALAVKIDNISLARPQAGVDRADVVVEELVEGGLTRLFGVFQCDAAASVGPIRSARPVDGDLLALLNGSVFGYSGANPRAIARVRRHANAVLISNDDLPHYFHRDNARPAPHNVFSSTELILRGGLQRRRGLSAPRPLFDYGGLSAQARPATHVAVTWPAASAAWTWNGRVWLRTQNGTPDNVVGGRRIHAANVVVMSIGVRPSGIRDVLGNETPDDVVTGTGRVWVFRDGHVVTGHWSRPTWRKRMQLLDPAGRAIDLQRGKTWIELLPRPRQPAIR